MVVNNGQALGRSPVADRVRRIAIALGCPTSETGDRVSVYTRATCHDDKDPQGLSIGSHDSHGQESATGYPLVYCHARQCDYETIYEALVSRGVDAELLRAPKAHAAVSPRSAAVSGAAAVDVNYVPDALWMPQMLALRSNPGRRNALAEMRGIPANEFDGAMIGWDARAKRYTIPIFDAEGRCVNVRSYSPKPSKGQPKILGLRGHPNRLYVPGDELVATRRTLYCAGEWDALAATAHGWQAVTHTGGESSHVPEGDKRLLKGMDVYVVYDADEAGVKGAIRVADDLTGTARSVSIVQLPDDLGEKADLTDLYRAGRGSELPGLVERASPWAVEGGDLGTWASQDLAAVLNDSYEPELPTIGHRLKSDVALFYPGRVHALISESEAGKTWLALHVCQQEIALGNVVYYLDFEDSVLGVVQRLRQMGCSVQDLERRFRYVQPDEAFESRKEAVLARLRRDRPSLVVLDGVTEAMVQNNWRQNVNDEIAKLFQTVLRPMAKAGAAVVMLDHLPKSEEGSAGRGAIGGVAKLNGIDGAAYRLKAVRPIVKGREGLSRVTIDKDRPGEVKRHQDDAKGIADLVVNSDEDGEVEVFLAMPIESGAVLAQREERKAEGEAQRHSMLRQEIADLLGEKPGLSQTKVVREFMGSGYGTETVKAVLDQMLADGSLRGESGPRNAVLHFLPEAGIPVSEREVAR
jgi:hypothetical protein